MLVAQKNETAKACGQRSAKRIFDIAISKIKQRKQQSFRQRRDHQLFQRHRSRRKAISSCRQTQKKRNHKGLRPRAWHFGVRVAYHRGNAAKTKSPFPLLATNKHADRLVIFSESNQSRLCQSLHKSPYAGTTFFFVYRCNGRRVSTTNLRLEISLRSNRDMCVHFGNM